MPVEISPANDDPGLPRPGELLAGKFRIERMVGRGGMGAVFAARHELLRQRVAIKMLLTEVVTNREAVARFLNEARAASRIEGENVARVLDTATLEDGRPYMVIEYLDGVDLAALLEARGPLPAVEAVDHVLQALVALAQAHALGIVHRDFKPSNLFLARRADGTTIVKVLDFGIAKATQPLNAQEQAAMTRSNSVLGSPQYMAPEQLRNARTVDARTDIWSVGLTIYELLTGRPPFSAESFGELFAAILEQSPAPLRGLRPDVDPDLAAIVHQCLRRNPAERFQNVADLARALARHGSPRSAFSVDRIVSWLPPPPAATASPASPTTAETRTPSAVARRRGATALGTAKTAPRSAPLFDAGGADPRHGTVFGAKEGNPGEGFGAAQGDAPGAAVIAQPAAETTAPPFSNTKSSTTPRRTAALLTGALIVAAAGGGAAIGLLRGGGATHAARAGLVPSVAMVPLPPSASPPAESASLAPATTPATELNPSGPTSAPPSAPTHAAIARPRPGPGTAAPAAPPSALALPSSGTPATSPFVAPSAVLASSRASAPDGSAPRPPNRADQTGLAGDNPF